ncbi:MAG: M20 family metallopeptidase [Microgenomates group bacterium]
MDIDRIKKEIIKKIEKSKKEEINFLKKLIQIPSVNYFTKNPLESKPDVPIEKGVAQLIFKKLKSFGLKPKYEGLSIKRPNVVCVLGKGRKTLIFNGHMDTVPPTEEWGVDPFRGIIRDKKIYGCGALDMKSALCCYVFMIKALLDFEKELKGKVLLQFVIDEEPMAASKFGTYYLLEKGYTGDAAIIGEPGAQKITIGNKGGYRFKIETFGESVHTGSREWEQKIKGKNAIIEMVKIINAFQKIKFPKKEHPIFPGRKNILTFPTSLEGGKAINVVPDVCIAFGDMRILPGITQRSIEKKIKNKIDKLGLNYKLIPLVYVPAVFIKKNELIVNILKKNAEKILGKSPAIEGSGPWSDMWMFISKGIPAVNFGCDGGGMHSKDKYVEVDSLIEVTKVYALTALDFLNS